jgi:hypothetical protein
MARAEQATLEVLSRMIAAMASLATMSTGRSPDAGQHAGPSLLAHHDG